jgi:intracellular multiplication protein IcmG
MKNSDDTSLELEDDFYDDVLEENFEEESFGEDYDDLGELDDGVEDQEWDDLEDSNFDESLVKQEKSGSGLSFNTIVIIGAVIVGGGVFAYQVTSKKPIQTVQRFTSALSLSGATDGPIFGGNKTSEEPVTEAATPTGEPINVEEGFLFEPDVLDSMEVELNDAPPMPNPISQEVNIEPNGLLEDNIQNTDIVKIQEPLPEIPRAPDELIIEKITPVAEEKIENVEPVKEVPVEQVAVSTPVESVTVSEPVVATIPSNIEKTLDRIVSRLDDMEVQMKQIQGAGNSKIEGLKEEVRKLKRAPKVTNVKKTAAPKVVKKSPAVSAPISWELRAAQPGKAWISKKGQKNIRPVIVGDNLSGVGRITAISFVNGRWIVQGSAGRIRQ